MLGPALDGLGQFLRSDLAQREINGRQMLSIEGVEFGVVGRAVLWTEPPAPVAAFSGKQRLVGFFKSCLRWSARPFLFLCFDAAGVSFAGVPEKFPGCDVLGVADPNVEICVDPGGRE